MLTRSGHPVGLKSVLVAALFAAASATSASAQAAAKPQKPVADEAAIRASAEEYQKAFNKGDAKALAASWTTDGELVDERGRMFHGRDAIEKEFEAIFAEHAGAKIDVDVESVKFVTPDVAVESGTAQARSKNGPAGPPLKYTAVHVKRDGKWLLSSVNESRPTTLTGAQHLAGLGWMVGKWKADLADGKTYHMTCQWMPEKSFLSRTFTVDEGNTTVSSGTQIIGWEPASGQIVSWTFDSSGGIGHEMWEDHGSQWRIAASSIMPDGAISLATNLMVKINDNAFTWRSVQRSLNEQSLSDTAQVRVQRVSQ